MKVVAVIGSDASGRSALADRLTERLAERGTVGTIVQGEQYETDGPDVADSRAVGASQTYAIDDGKWVGAGEDLTLAGALDRLAETCEYAVIDGSRRLRLPTVVLGDETIESDRTIYSAASNDEADLSEILEQLETVHPYESLQSLVARLKRSAGADRSGAIATFTGRVRAKDHPDDEKTTHLEFEKYDRVADKRLATIREELVARDGIYEVLLHHRTGVVEAGEDIVFVVVLAGHRPEAFQTVEDGINRLKEEVPLFKKEVTVTDDFWAHER